jgi:hypothetical protein
MDAYGRQIVQIIAGAMPISWIVENKCKIGPWMVHARRVSSSKNDGSYGFSVYENALSHHDWEIWICGQAGWYLVPLTQIREMYPHAYPLITVNRDAV